MFPKTKHFVDSIFTWLDELLVTVKESFIKFIMSSTVIVSNIKIISVRAIAKPCLAAFLEDAKPLMRRFSV